MRQGLRSVWRDRLAVVVCILTFVGYAFGASVGRKIRSDESCLCPIWTRNRAASLGLHGAHPVRGLSAVEKQLMHVAHVTFSARKMCVNCAASRCRAWLSFGSRHSRAIPNVVSRPSILGSFPIHIPQLHPAILNVALIDSPNWKTSCRWLSYRKT